MITTVCLDSAAKKLSQNFPASDINEFCMGKQNVVWADVNDPPALSFSAYGTLFSISFSELKS